MGDDVKIGVSLRPSVGKGAQSSAAMTKPACSGCRHMAHDGRDLVCRRMPPQVTIVLVPAPPPRAGQIIPQALASFPTVQADMWCGEYGPAPVGLHS